MEIVLVSQDFWYAQFLKEMVAYLVFIAIMTNVFVVMIIWVFHHLQQKYFKWER